MLFLHQDAGEIAKEAVTKQVRGIRTPRISKISIGHLIE
jgi:hypothetical protein